MQLGYFVNSKGQCYYPRQSDRTDAFYVREHELKAVELVRTQNPKEFKAILAVAGVHESISTYKSIMIGNRRRNVIMFHTQSKQWRIRRFLYSVLEEVLYNDSYAYDEYLHNIFEEHRTRTNKYIKQTDIKSLVEVQVPILYKEETEFINTLLKFPNVQAINTQYTRIIVWLSNPRTPLILWMEGDCINALAPISHVDTITRYISYLRIICLKHHVKTLLYGKAVQPEETYVENSLPSYYNEWGTWEEQ